MRRRRGSLERPDGHRRAGSRHGARAGPHRVPAGFVVRHLIIVPFLLAGAIHSSTRWRQRHAPHRDPDRALIYFWADWVRLVPAGLAAMRDRSFRNDPDRPPGVASSWRPPSGRDRRLPVQRHHPDERPRSWARGVDLVVGAGILWFADQRGGRAKGVVDVSFPVALGIGAAQAVALVPGISRSGISIAAARFAGLDREAAARFSVPDGDARDDRAAIFELRKLIAGEAGTDVSVGPLVVGMVALLRCGDSRDRNPVALRADALAQRLRLVPACPGRSRARGLARALGATTTDGGHEAAPPTSNPGRRRAAHDPHPAGAGGRASGTRFRTTQATISRDVGELGLIKVLRDGMAAYALPPRLIEAETSGEDRLRKLLADLPVEIHDAGLLLVISHLQVPRTPSPRPRPCSLAGSGGSIAGDDTLFVAFPDRASLQRIKRRLSGSQAQPVRIDPDRISASGRPRAPLTPLSGATTIRARSELQARGVGANDLEFFPLSKTEPVWPHSTTFPGGLRP